MKKLLQGGWWKFVLGFGLLAGVIYVNWKPDSDAGLAAVWQKHVVQGQPLHWAFFGFAFLISTASVLLTFVRWWVLVRAQGLPFPLGNCFRLGLMGYFLNTFLPGSVGGDLVKAACIAREQSRRTVAVTTVIIDRAIGLWGLCWIVALLGGAFWAGGYLQGESATTCQSITAGAAVVVASSIVVWFLLGFLPAHRADRFSRRLENIPKVGHAAAEFWRAIWMCRAQAKSTWLALGLALIGHVGFVLTFYFAARTVQDADQIPSLTTHFLIIPIGMALQAGFPAPGGVGGGEVIFGFLYRLVGFPAANGVLMSLSNRSLSWILGAIGGLVYLRMRPALQTVKDELTSASPLGRDDAA